jgi:hypothetical protein
MVLMMSLTEFAKTTPIGGLCIILPVYISLLLLAKAIQALFASMKPMTEEIPASRALREALAILALAAVCFIAGLIVRMDPGLRAKNAFEEAVLERVLATRCYVALQDASPGGPSATHRCGNYRDAQGILNVGTGAGALARTMQPISMSPNVNLEHDDGRGVT